MINFQKFIAISNNLKRGAMIKKIVVMLIVLLAVFAQSVIGQDLIQPYEIGSEKEIHIPDVMLIEYKNVLVSDTQVRIIGTVTVPQKYTIASLAIRYCVLDINQNKLQIVLLDLVNTTRNTFTFDVKYPLDLKRYKGELFVIEFYNKHQPSTLAKRK